MRKPHPNKGKLNPMAAERARIMANMVAGGATLQEVGNKYNISRERVRQVLGHYGYTSRSGVRSVRLRDKIERVSARFELIDVSTWHTVTEVAKVIGVTPYFIRRYFPGVQDRLAKTWYPPGKACKRCKRKIADIHYTGICRLCIYAIKFGIYRATHPHIIKSISKRQNDKAMVKNREARIEKIKTLGNRCYKCNAEGMLDESKQVKYSLYLMSDNVLVCTDCHMQNVRDRKKK